MKKICKLLCLILTTSCVLMFSACGNQGQTLARNLDDTITNLIYSASTLDWADEKMINNLSTNYQKNQNDNIQNASPYLSQDDLTNNYENGEILYQNNNQNNQLTEQQSEQIRLNKMNSKMSGNKGKRAIFKNKPVRSINNNFRYNLPQRKQSINQNNFNKENYTIQNIAANVDNVSNDDIYMLNYFTDAINSSSESVKAMINEIINKRSYILMDINDLYKGNIKISGEQIKAINTYLNIIKETISYLNSNKGIVTNQLEQANDILSSNSNTRLVNAYIIRTNEAIQTRLAKLESASYAIDAIYNILNQNNGTYLNNSYSQKTQINNQNDIKPDQNQQIERDLSILNVANADSNLDVNNKNNNCENCEKITDCNDYLKSKNCEDCLDNGKCNSCEDDKNCPDCDEQTKQENNINIEETLKEQTLETSIAPKNIDIKDEKTEIDKNEINEKLREIQRELKDRTKINEFESDIKTESESIEKPQKNIENQEYEQFDDEGNEKNLNEANDRNQELDLAKDDQIDNNEQINNDFQKTKNVIENKKDDKQDQLSHSIFEKEFSLY